MKTPPLDWAYPGSPEWKIKVGDSKPGGGTYSTIVTHPETGQRTRKTWRYDQQTIDTPILKELLPFEQPEKIEMDAPAWAHAGAEVMDFSNTYMDAGHNPGYLLDLYRENIPKKLKVDTLVGTGVSGTIAVVNLARDLGLDYLIIRKPGEHCHSSWPAEGRLGHNWLFVDDVVSSGATFRRVWETMGKITQEGFPAVFRGVFLYQSGGEFYAPGPLTERWATGKDDLSW